MTDQKTGKSFREVSPSDIEKAIADAISSLLNSESVEVEINDIKYVKGLGGLGNPEEEYVRNSDSINFTVRINNRYLSENDIYQGCLLENKKGRE